MEGGVLFFGLINPSHDPTVHSHPPLSPQGTPVGMGKKAAAARRVPWVGEAWYDRPEPQAVHLALAAKARQRELRAREPLEYPTWLSPPQQPRAEPTVLALAASVRFRDRSERAGATFEARAVSMPTPLPNAASRSERRAARRAEPLAQSAHLTTDRPRLIEEIEDPLEAMSRLAGDTVDEVKALLSSAFRSRRRAPPGVEGAAAGEVAPGVDGAPEGAPEDAHASAHAQLESVTGLSGGVPASGADAAGVPRAVRPRSRTFGA